MAHQHSEPYYDQYLMLHASTLSTKGISTHACTMIISSSFPVCIRLVPLIPGYRMWILECMVVRSLRNSGYPTIVIRTPFSVLWREKTLNLIECCGTIYIILAHMQFPYMIMLAHKYHLHNLISLAQKYHLRDNHAGTLIKYHGTMYNHHEVPDYFEWILVYSIHNFYIDRF